MAEATTYTLNLLKINCYRQDEGDGDEVFLKYKKERIWPLNTKYKKITEGECDLKVDIPAIKHGETVEIELWDYDFLTPNDKLGVFKMLINEKGGPFVTDLQTKASMGAKYSLEWELH